MPDIIRYIALRKLKEKVLQLRQQGMSYSQIKAVVKVSKGTLSDWLKNISLPEERIRELRDFNAIRIEKCRNTKALKRNNRLEMVYRKAEKDIGTLKNMSEREVFLFGLFLYWGEGSKTDRYCIEITNTDPSMIKFALLWFKTIGVNKEDLKIRLKIYKDIDKEHVTNYWIKVLGVDKTQFRYQVKRTNQSDITYKTGFGHGTCSLVYRNRDKGEYITQSLKYIRNLFL